MLAGSRRYPEVVMAFCTLLQWDSGFPFDRYEEMNRRAQVHEVLPEGCLTRIVGGADGAATIIEVWQSGDDARRFSEQHAHLLAEFAMPRPAQVAAFEATIFQTR
jgi:hypothetical protein